jgi:hypothetical protein
VSRCVSPGDGRRKQLRAQVERRRPHLYPWNTGKPVCWDNWGRLIPCHPDQTKQDPDGYVLVPEDK